MEVPWDDLRFEQRNRLVQDLLRMLEQGSQNDVKIKLADGEIIANKDILTARSDYFATMFSNDRFLEGETSSVDMSHCSKAVMGNIIKFLFSGELTFDLPWLNLTQLLELTHTAEMMLLDTLKDEVVDCVEELVVNSVETKYVPELIEGLKLANTYSLIYIKKIIIQELNFSLSEIPDDVSASDSFKTLPYNLMKEIMQSDDDKYYISSTPRCKVFMVWLSENEITEEQKDVIVESLNLEDFTAEVLLEVRDLGLFPTKKIDERVIELLEIQKKLMEEKDSMILEKDSTILELRLKVRELKDTLADVRNLSYALNNTIDDANLF